MPLALELESRQRERRNAGEPGMSSEKIKIAEQQREAYPPGDRRQRKVVTAHPQRDEAQEKRDREGDDEPDGQRKPRRRPIACRQIRSRVRTEPHERGLPE